MKLLFVLAFGFSITTLAAEDMIANPSASTTAPAVNATANVEAPVGTIAPPTKKQLKSVKKPKKSKTETH